MFGLSTNLYQNGESVPATTVVLDKTVLNIFSSFVARFNSFIHFYLGPILRRLQTKIDDIIGIRTDDRMKENRSVRGK